MDLLSLDKPFRDQTQVLQLVNHHLLQVTGRARIDINYTCKTSGLVCSFKLAFKATCSSSEGHNQLSFICNIFLTIVKKKTVFNKTVAVIL